MILLLLQFGCLRGLWVESAPAAEEEEQLLCPWIWCFLKLLLRLLGKFHCLRSWRTCCSSVCFFSQSVCFQNWVSELNLFHICLTHETTSSCWVVDWKNNSNGISLVFFFFPQIIWLVFILLYLCLAFQKHSVSAWEESPKVHHHLTKCGADNKQTFTCCFTKFYH